VDYKTDFGKDLCYFYSVCAAAQSRKSGRKTCVEGVIVCAAAQSNRVRRELFRLRRSAVILGLPLSALPHAFHTPDRPTANPGPDFGGSQKSEALFFRAAARCVRKNGFI
jgi:hypothetical protein